MRKGKNVIEFENRPSILNWAAVVGKKEGEGPLGEDFDLVLDDPKAGKGTWEEAESEFQRKSIEVLLNKSHLTDGDIDILYAGDLLNQCSGSGFGLRDFDIPFSGVYGACSTSVLAMINAAIAVDGGAVKRAISSTSSHFCSAEKQFRFPLEYGGQRTPTSQWTVTGAASALIGDKSEKSCPRIERAIFGKIVDKGVTDANNMGAAMAPDSDKLRPCQKGIGFYTKFTKREVLHHTENLLTTSIENSVKIVYNDMDYSLYFKINF